VKWPCRCYGSRREAHEVTRFSGVEQIAERSTRWRLSYSQRLTTNRRWTFAISEQTLTQDGLCVRSSSCCPRAASEQVTNADACEKPACVHVALLLRGLLITPRFERSAWMASAAHSGRGHAAIMEGSLRSARGSFDRTRLRLGRGDTKRMSEILSVGV
jgi:hypothetical protein